MGPGALAHAARITVNASDRRVRAFPFASESAQCWVMDSGFWIFLLEGAVALALLIFIVWWTLPKKRPPDEKQR